MTEQEREKTLLGKCMTWPLLLLTKTLKRRNSVDASKRLVVTKLPKGENYTNSALNARTDYTA